MTIEKLREAIQATPFRPFTISLADGRRIHVPSREFLLVPPKAERTFVVAENAEDYRIVDLLLVTTLDFETAPKRRDNGHGRRGRR